jgi:hypothetical protein
MIIFHHLYILSYCRMLEVKETSNSEIENDLHFQK